ncbi:hypothetical protein NA56DRAFT_433163 [Hyaloscypha hepaticicola]|uniref:Uncharacterized protein n=1 Tax=Hyaloscypha hepaticicola TaxID=2082293 RepID=A0A2J6QGG7_9HELO|nr:hypothetical protein NA56DRAFT_433163 [Hyaloscypha hepaticicola]
MKGRELGERGISINILAPPRLLLSYFFQLGLLKLGFYSNTLVLCCHLSFNIHTTILRVLHHSLFPNTSQKTPPATFPKSSSTSTSSKMPSQTPTPIALPVPRRRSPLLTNASLGQPQDVSLFLSNTLSSKAKAPYNFISRIDENDYSPPAPPPPSPVNFPSESWSTACSVRR